MTDTRLRQRLSIVLNMALALIVAILLGQLWLFTIVIDAMQAEHASFATATAAVAVSFVGAAAVWALIRFFLKAEADQ